MRHLLLISLTAFTIIGCSSNAQNSKGQASNDNYVVILDLSDRLIQKVDQVNFDTSAIRAVFDRFEKSVQKNIIVKSKDKFSIRIIPQELSSLPGNTFENNLSIDMGKYNASEKLAKLNEFKKDFPTNLKLLYQQAILGKNTSDFAGVDIFQYFNDQVNSDLNAGYNNKVLILTDGYFDFEDKAHGIKTNIRSTTTAPLLVKMKGLNWMNEIQDKQLGILPVRLTVPAKWLVCGIQSKPTSKDLLEVEKLSFLWVRWLKESGAVDVVNPMVNSSSDKVKNLIMNTL